MYELVNRSFCDLSRSCRLSVYIGGCSYNLAFHFKKYRVTTSQNFIYFFLYTGDFHGFSLLKSIKKALSAFYSQKCNLYTCKLSIQVTIPSFLLLQKVIHTIHYEVVLPLKFSRIPYAPNHHIL